MELGSLGGGLYKAHLKLLVPEQPVEVCAVGRVEKDEIQRIEMLLCGKDVTHYYKHNAKKIFEIGQRLTLAQRGQIFDVLVILTEIGRKYQDHVIK